MSKPCDKAISALNEVEDEINKTSSDNEQPSEFQLDLKELRHYQTKNNSCYQIPYYRSLENDDEKSGSISRFFKRVVRRLCRFLIEPICNDISDFNASVTASINAIYYNETVIQNLLNKYKNIFESYSDDMTKVEEYISLLNTHFAEIYATLSSLSNSYDQNIEQIQFLESQLQNINIQISNINERLNASIIEYDKKLTDAEVNFLRKSNYSGVTANENISSKQDEEQIISDEKTPDHSDVYSGLDYFKFENRFRGPRTVIKERQELYIPYFEGKGTVLDLGCGRGEFLELLQENHIPAIGVDSYSEFVEYCTMKGLDARIGRVPDYLRDMEDNSVGGIFAAQLVEHISFDELVELCYQSHRILNDGGCFIVETPNPTSLAIYTNSFYVDPSHNKPVHPVTLQYIMEQQGFNNIQILFTEQSKVDYRLPLLSSSTVDNLEEFNNGINRLSDLLFGSQDYAIIAYK